MKICSGCKTAKPATAEFFAPHTDCKGGLNAKCRLCVQARQRQWKRANSIRRAARRRELYREKTGPILRAKERARAAAAPFLARARVMRDSLRARCKEMGLPVPAWVTADYLQAWLKSQPACPCCGRKFRIEIYAGQICDESPSLDRFESTRGYERENVSLICWRCNNIKRNYRAEDLRMVAAWIDGRQPQDLFDAA